jgi:hypothetical protein
MPPTKLRYMPARSKGYSVGRAASSADAARKATGNQQAKTEAARRATGGVVTSNQALRLGVRLPHQRHDGASKFAAEHSGTCRSLSKIS